MLAILSPLSGFHVETICEYLMNSNAQDVAGATTIRITPKRGKNGTIWFRFFFANAPA
jgi:hypothetical protein